MRARAGVCICFYVPYVWMCACACVRAADVWFAIFLVMRGWVYASNTLALVRLYPSWSRMLILPMGHAHIIHTCFNEPLEETIILVLIKNVNNLCKHNAHNNSLSRYLS